MRLPWQTRPMDRERLIRAAIVIAALLDHEEHEQVAALQQIGFGEGEAWRLINLLPMAFSRPILEELGVAKFSPTVSAVNSDGVEIIVKLSKQPEYIGALDLARAHRNCGAMDHAVYKRIVDGSAEIDAASNALNAGEDLRGSFISTVFNGTKIANFLIR